MTRFECDVPALGCSGLSDLSSPDLSRANLAHANLDKADLRDAKSRSASLMGGSSGRSPTFATMTL